MASGKKKAFGIGFVIVLFALLSNALSGFAQFIVAWFAFFMVLLQLLEITTGADLTLMYILLMILFLVGFLIKGDDE
ncbi:MAG: hypothetical protein ACP6IU_15020 [Candidatus Asgardarchaeia archaeon]